MGMTILKRLYWNLQCNFFCLSDKIFHNLKNKQCETYIFLMSDKPNSMDFNKIGNDSDDDCYIVSDSDVNRARRANDQNISTVAHEFSTAPGGSSSGSSRGNTLPSVRSSRRRQQQNFQESTGSSYYRSPSESNSHNNLALQLNPFANNNFVNYHAFFQSRGLSFLNIPICNTPPNYYEQTSNICNTTPNYHEQRPNFRRTVPNYQEQRSNMSRQRFRNESLFSESTTLSSSSIIEPGEQRSSFEICKKEDKDNIKAIRKWVPVNELGPNPGMNFTLISYNVLAQDLLVEHSQLYRNHSARALLWETRWNNLYEEILENNPDIICLQEVQEDHLKDYYHQFLKKGYAHIFKKKTGYRTDGCAIYYKKAVFKLIENTSVEYNQNFPVLDRDNVAIIAKFAPVDNLQAEFVVATTHLLYNPKREDVRLAQTQLLLTEIDRISYTNYKDGKRKYTPIIITGDFNTKPQSAVYRLIVEGKLKYENLSKKVLKEGNCTKGLEGKVLITPALRITDTCQHVDLIETRLAGRRLTRDEERQLINIKHQENPVPQKPAHTNTTLFSTGVLSHSFNMQSAFLHKIGEDVEGTTFQNKWITVDYIFYSGAFSKRLKKVSDEKLRLIARYSIPTGADLRSKIRHIPNCALGSDHLALLAKFKLEY